MFDPTSAKRSALEEIIKMAGEKRAGDLKSKFSPAPMGGKPGAGAMAADTAPEAGPSDPGATDELPADAGGGDAGDAGAEAGGDAGGEMGLGGEITPELLMKLLELLQAKGGGAGAAPSGAGAGPMGAGAMGAE